MLIRAGVSLRRVRHIRPPLASFVRPVASGHLNSWNFSLTIENQEEKFVDDMKFLGGVLKSLLEARKPGVLDVVTQLRRPARTWRDPAFSDADKDKAFEELCRNVSRLSPEMMCDVTRALSHFLALANLAESRDQTRSLRQLYFEHGGAPDQSDALPAKLDSCAGTIEVIINEDGASAAKIFQALVKQQTEIVFTAHPTEVNRLELLKKHRDISELLAQRDAMSGGDSTAFERAQNERAIRRGVAAMWGSDVLRRRKPTPQEEAREGLAVLQTSLWDAVPSYMRRLDAVMLAQLQQRLPLDASPVVFASWMGGDRDGNPNVKSGTTREVVVTQRRQAALMYLRELSGLRLELSVKECTPALTALSGTEAAEPYKAVVEQLIARLRATVAWADAELQRLGATPDARPLALMISADGVAGQSAEPLLVVEELAVPLRVMHESLVASGYAELADGALVDVLRRVGAFGLQFAPLDLRQESTRHARAVHALCQQAGEHGYLSWTEDERVAWLSKELGSGRPLLRRGVFERLGELGVGAEENEVLQTVALTAELPPGSLKAYVISQATAASDVLAVELLMAEAGAVKPLPVAPLFETLDDLNNAPGILRQLFTTPGYAERTGRSQMVMVGYSDSAKDAGRIAAMWAQYESQEKMLEVAKECGFEISFFHGKGGTVGRGGNPEVYKAILAHPQGTIDGKFRVTEQGEMITRNFGDIDSAERAMDIFTAAVLRDQFLQRPVPTPEWRAAMAAMSACSCDFYRSVVREEPKFVPYFRAATPELELGSLNVGSRPAKRNPKGGVESLRAIPWIFAWAQTRLNLPAWLGIGKALEGALADGSGPVGKEELQRMYKDWPWFHTTIDLIEMLMAKSDRTIAKHYDDKLVTDKELLKLGAHLRERFEVTERSILSISGHSAPADDYPDLQRSLRARRHYIDVLNVIQVEALARLRAAEAAGATKGYDYVTLKDALLLTINGIATGMRNSG
uniref:phosphoenolpyruvate carboxylase n=1 Tax=Zooxanthella nutricula TaxID=1333877 RepID=A0A7S2MAA9_9DINO|mmetsp:Transcript_74319/g.227382  ORF Transcript_74319/g.227382 Transcript_74319/m.227382 type:complete len:977 (+) Transcript_74319:99-3029(+)